MKYKYLDENYSPSHVLWGFRGQLITMVHSLEELYSVDFSLHVKDYHKVMMLLDDLDTAIGNLRHSASRVKLCDFPLEVD